jgi:hypothetical protein
MADATHEQADRLFAQILAFSAAVMAGGQIQALAAPKVLVPTALEQPQRRPQSTTSLIGCGAMELIAAGKLAPVAGHRLLRVLAVAIDAACSFEHGSETVAEIAASIEHAADACAYAAGTVESGTVDSSENGFCAEREEAVIIALSFLMQRAANAASPVAGKQDSLVAISVRTQRAVLSSSSSVAARGRPGMLARAVAACDADIVNTLRTAATASMMHPGFPDARVIAAARATGVAWEQALASIGVGLGQNEQP